MFGQCVVCVYVVEGGGGVPLYEISLRLTTNHLILPCPFYS